MAPEWPGKDILVGPLLLTILLPSQIAIVPQYIIFEHIGWLNTCLPLIVPKFTAIDAFFTFIYTWNDFLGLSQFVDATGRSRLGALFAMSVLLLVPVAAVFAAAQRLFTDDISTTGIK